VDFVRDGHDLAIRKMGSLKDARAADVNHGVRLCLSAGC